MLSAWKIAAWLSAHPDRRPYKKNLTAFISRWIARDESAAAPRDSQAEADWKDRLYERLCLRNPRFMTVQ